jgi:Zn-dependent peptidase ImmA (M78 family)/DNA-binding XRE family transcriptional regulator
MFNPSRLSLARKRRGMNKIRVAGLVGVTPRSISAYESGDMVPSTETVDRLATVLRFPAGFFFGGDLDAPLPETASFRSMSRMTAAQRDAALGAGAIAFLLNEWIEARFDLPAPDLLDLRGEDPEAAAMALRRHWGLGELPIRNMVHLLEAKGVRVYSLAEHAVEVDAFSLWRGNTPFLFLNTLKSAEHGRLDAAHELGHLVLHRHGGPRGQDAEKQAQTFGSAFLMPRGSVLSIAPQLATMNHILQLKKRWIVSAAALIYRLHAIGMLSEWHYRTLMVEASARGFRKKEPEGAQRETSQVLAQVFATLRDEGVSKADVAWALHLEPDEINRLVFGLMLTGMSGAASNDVLRTKPRGRLHLVK